MLNRTRVRCDEVPLETIQALHDLMVVLCEAFPDPTSLPSPVRRALRDAIDHWMEALGEAGDDDDS